MVSFNRGDLVRVCNRNLRTYRQIGRVVSDSRGYVEVNIPGYSTLCYKKENIELVSRTKDSNYADYVEHDVTTVNEVCKKENNNMAVKGNYDVALVKFVQGMNTTKKYAFALFDNAARIDDTVLVDTNNGYGVAVISEIHSKADYEELGCSLPTKEVISKIDFTAFDERKAKRVKAAKLKNDMDKMVKSLQEIAVFELLAEKSPELKAMLDEYKQVVE